MTHKTRFLLIPLVLISVNAGAVDLGVQGKIWPIAERDVRELMLEQLSATDEDKIQRKLQDSFDTFFDRLPKRTFLSPDKNNTKLVDVSITAQEDIVAPIKNELGLWVNTVVVKKGTVSNPLLIQPPTSALLFFDGADKEQVAVVERLMERFPYTVFPVETAGNNFKPLLEKFNRPLFFGNPEITDKFKITELPSLVYPSYGQSRGYLAVTSLSRPFNAKIYEKIIEEAFPSVKELTTTKSAQ